MYTSLELCLLPSYGLLCMDFNLTTYCTPTLFVDFTVHIANVVTELAYIVINGYANAIT